MNFIPRNPWELDMAQWQCLAAENKHRQEVQDELDRLNALTFIINDFNM